MTLQLRVALAAVAMGMVGASIAHAQVIRGQLIAQGFDRPVAFVQDPTEPAVWFIVEQGGLIRTLVNGTVGGNFLSLVGQVSLDSEQGLLGLAFAPDYVTSRRFFVNFTNPAGLTVVARFERSAGNPLVADPMTRKDLVWPDGNPFITRPSPFVNHNGGHLAFGPDGFLYIGLGDGGFGDDPFHLAQTPGTLLGKMLRIDVDVPDNDPEGYDVPGNNPFLGDPVVLPEIWAFGFRNPWRYNFDNPALGGTGALVIGDVGQSEWEEIDYEPAGAGGRNYGWRNREAAHPNPNPNLEGGNLPPYFLPLRDPIHEYPHPTGHSITGGFVYRGSNLGASYRGRYFFGDFVNNKVWSLGLALDGSGEATAVSLIEHTSTLGALVAQNPSTFGVDANGEIYLVSYTGRIYRLVLDLVSNGDFSGGMTGWQTFATPDSSYLVGSVVNGVFEFYRQPPPPGTTNQAVIFYQTGVPVGANMRFAAQFDLGNSSTARKRLSVLIHDSNFNDVVVCAFWLAPGAPLRTYRVSTHAIETWSNATISFYAATTGSDGGAYRLDNVSLQPDFDLAHDRTDCIDPTAPAPPGGAPGPNLIANGTFGAGLGPWGLFGQIVSQISGGVFEFYRPAGTPAGVVLQQTGTGVGTNAILSATFQLGNSSGVRTRVTVLLHTADFSDLVACTFWLAPGQGLVTYGVRGFATQSWANATLSVYPSTIGTAEWMRLDNVVLQATPGQPVLGTECLEPPSGFSLPAPQVFSVRTSGEALLRDNLPEPYYPRTYEDPDSLCRSGCRGGDVRRVSRARAGRAASARRERAGPTARVRPGPDAA